MKNIYSKYINIHTPWEYSPNWTPSKMENYAFPALAALNGKKERERERTCSSRGHQLLYPVYVSSVRKNQPGRESGFAAKIMRRTNSLAGRSVIMAVILFSASWERPKKNIIKRTFTRNGKKKSSDADIIPSVSFVNEHVAMTSQ